MSRKYILDEHGEPILEPDLMKWAKTYEHLDRTVGRTQVGGFDVSTVFLGVDHNYSQVGPPVLWETMVFNDKGENVFMERCSGSREQAEAMHEAMADSLRLGQSNEPRP